VGVGAGDGVGIGVAAAIGEVSSGASASARSPWECEASLQAPIVTALRRSATRPSSVGSVRATTSPVRSRELPTDVVFMCPPSAKAVPAATRRVEATLVPAPLPSGATLPSLHRARRPANL